MEIMEMTEQLFEEAQRSVDAIAKQIGLKAPKEPSPEVKDMEFPSDITLLTLREVSRHMSCFTQMASYAESLVSFFDTNSLALDTQIKLKEAEVILSFKGTALERKSKVLVETKDLVEKKLSVDVAYSYIHMLLKNYERYCQVLSRDLTRRLSENANIGRNLKNE